MKLIIYKIEFVMIKYICGSYISTMDQNFMLSYYFQNISIEIPLSSFSGISSQDIYICCLNIIYKKFVGDDNNELDNNGLYKRIYRPALCNILYKNWYSDINTIEGYKYHTESNDEKTRIIDSWVTPLHLFVELYYYNKKDDKLIFDMMDIYLNNFPKNIDINDKIDNTALNKVLHLDFSEKRKYKLLRFLLERGSNVRQSLSYKRWSGFGVLHNLSKNITECCEDWCYCLDFMLNSGIDINSVGFHGDTILHIYNNRYNVNLLEHLLSKGLNVNIKNNEGNNVLHALMKHARSHLKECYNNIESFEIIINKILNINDTNNNGETAIDILCARGFSSCPETSLKFKQLLLDHGSNQPIIKPIFSIPSVLSYIPFISYFTNTDANNNPSSNVNEEKSSVNIV